MNLLSLSFSYIRVRWLTNMSLVFLLAIGVGTISLLLHFNHQVEQRLQRDARGFDLVVGAKGSPLQLILSSIYHMDIPTGNISVKEAERLRKHPHVKQAIPLALGDSYRGFRIVGTETSYIEHYKAEFYAGKLFSSPMEVVIGARVAKDTSMMLGGTFAGSHGLSEGGDEHSDSLYKVVGVLKPTGTVIDRLILTPVESVWEVHGSEGHHHEHETHEKHESAHRDHAHEESAHKEHEAHDKHSGEVEASDEITALLIRFQSPVNAMSLPREINRMTSMQAASPAYETARLLSLLGVGLDSLRFFGGILIMSAVVGMLIAVYQSMQERKTNIALMRLLGASKSALAKQIVLESGMLLITGILGGLVLSHAGLAMLPFVSTQFKDIGFMPISFLATEIYVVTSLMVAGLTVALLPALTAYRVDVSRTLAKA